MLKKILSLGFAASALTLQGVYSHEGPLFDALAQIDKKPRLERSIKSVRDAEISKYEGPLFDAMAQIDQKPGLERSIKSVKDAGISKIALFARSTKYLGHNEKSLIKLRDRHSDLIVLGAPKYFLHKNDISKSYIERTLKNIDKYSYSFVGEILYTHADKLYGTNHASGELYIDPLGENTIYFLNQLSKKNIPVMTHWEFYNWERDWMKFTKIYSMFPNVNFIIPHMGFGSIKQVEEILSKHNNVYMTVSKKEKIRTDRLSPYSSFSEEKLAKLGTGFLKRKKLKDEWRSVLIKYQDRLLFATDAHKTYRWKTYEKLVNRFRIILDQLPEDVAKKIAYKNAELLYGLKIN